MSIYLSIIIPVFNESESLPELHQRISESLKNSEFKTEILFVDDGSTDNSLAVIKQLATRTSVSIPVINWIAFRRNFGKAAALQAAFRNIHGTIIITMDADLQDEPSEINNLIAKITEGADVVSGWKFNRLDPWEKRLPSKLFNFAISFFSGIKLHDFNCGFKAYRKEVIEDLDIYGEFHRYIPVLASRKGFRIEEIKVKHNPRTHGKSKYGFERYFRGLFDCMSVIFLSKYSDRPMHFFGKIALFLGFSGFAICSYLTISWFLGQPLSARPLLLLGVLLLLLGTQFLAIGLIGEMLLESTYRGRYTQSHIKEMYLTHD
ncbi:glycosyl transferase [Opitutaceae bacterium TAV1]|nr:glycosyl transferase [Opitutaceae bacterium TAV1]